MVKKLDTHKAEKLSEQVAEMANKIRTSQDELITLLDEIARNRTEFRKGLISRDAYTENAKKMNEAEGELRRRIRNTIGTETGLISRMSSLLKSQRIEPKRTRRRRKSKTRARRTRRKATRTRRKSTARRVRRSSARTKRRKPTHRTRRKSTRRKSHSRTRNTKKTTRRRQKRQRRRR